MLYANVCAKIGAFGRFSYFMLLFLSHKNVNRRSGIAPIFAYLVFEVSLVRLFDPLRQVAEEDK